MADFLAKTDPDSYSIDDLKRDGTTEWDGVRNPAAVNAIKTMKPGDRVIWLYSPGRSFLSGWRRQEIPVVIVRVCRHRIRIRVLLGGRETIVNVGPENVLCGDEGVIVRTCRGLE